MGKFVSTLVKVLLPCVPRAGDTLPPPPTPFLLTAPTAARVAPAAPVAPEAPGRTNRRSRIGSGAEVSASAREYRRSLDSVAEGDLYRTTGALTGPQHRFPKADFKVSDLSQYELNFKEDGTAYQGERPLHGRYIRYVMDGLGNIFTDMDRNAKDHTSFFSNGRVAAAGEIWAEHGVIKRINNHSGHYKPTAGHVDQVIREFESRGLDFSNVHRDDFSGITTNIRYYRTEDGEFEGREKGY